MILVASAFVSILSRIAAKLVSMDKWKEIPLSKEEEEGVTVDGEEIYGE